MAAVDAVSLNGLRVAMVTARAHPLVGGVEVHVHEVATRLAAAGADLTVLTTDPAGDLPAEQSVAGYRIRRWSAYPRSRDFYLAPGLVAHLGRARKRYDILHVQGVHTLVAPAALAAARRAGLPSVLTFHTGGHSSGLRARLRPVQFRALAPLLRRAELIAVCDYERHLFGALLGIAPGRIRLIRNGSHPLPIDDATPRIPGSPLLVSVGRLERYKGHHRVLRALPAVLARAPQARLVLVGEGPFEARLREMAEELGVAERVSFTAFGPDRRGALGRLLADADVMVLLSDYEAHPVAVMEAVAAGTPALVADTSGLTELGATGLARTVAVDATPEQVAAAVLDMAAGPAPQPGALPDWDDCSAQLSRCYLEVSAAGSGSGW